jgi:hypothetical protein
MASAILSARVIASWISSCGQEGSTLLSNKTGKPGFIAGKIEPANDCPTVNSPGENTCLSMDFET